MIVLIHTSKTMRDAPRGSHIPDSPQLIGQSRQLAGYLRTLSPQRLATIMAVSPALAARTHQEFADWTDDPGRQAPAVDCFTGDIYSGLRAGEFSDADRDHAQRHLRILSGLYGILRPADGIRPYRLEMGYRLPSPRYASLYHFWGDTVARCLPATGPIVNLAAVEYSKVVTPHLDASRLVVPKFLTADPGGGQPKFVTVHAKIARGAFARWLIHTRTGTLDRLAEFADLGYRFDAAASTPRQPVYVCARFEGKGLSVRLAGC